MRNDPTEILSQTQAECLPGLSEAGAEELPAGDSAAPIPQLEGYTIFEALGRGGMGQVWKARHHGTRRNVALKMMHTWMQWSHQARARFEREIELAASLNHPGIASVYDSGLHRGLYYYTMQLVDGVALDEWARGLSGGDSDVLRIFQRVCESVQYAHRHRVMHRDLKPSNIVVTPEGDPVVLDFGLAKGIGYLDDSRSEVIDDGLAGTPVYMSPEQAMGRMEEVDTRSDVYSLGVIIYRLLTGGYPHDPSGSAMQVCQRIVEDAPVPPRIHRRELHHELETIILKAIDRDPGRRYQTSGELGDDLGRHLRREPIIARPPTVRYVLTRFASRHRFAMFIGVIVVAAAVAAAGYAYLRVSRAERVATDRLARMHVRSGVQAAQVGDHHVALEWFGEALRLQPHGREGFIHRVRLGSALRRSPALIREWGVGDHAVSDALLSGDGSVIVTVDIEAVRLWDAQSGRLLAGPWRHLQKKASVAVSRDAQRVAVWGESNGVHVWSVESEGSSVVLLHPLPVRAVSFSRDGTRLVTGTAAGHVRIWDASSGRLLVGPIRHTGPVTSIAFDRSGTQVVSSSLDGTSRVWDAVTGEPLTRPMRHPGYQGVTFGVNQAVFTPDGARVLSGGGDRSLLVWDAVTGRRIARAMTHSSSVTHLSVSEDGRYAVTGCVDGSVRVWHLQDGSPRTAVLPHGGAIRHTEFTQDGRGVVVASADGAVHVWDWSASPVTVTVIRHGGGLSGASISPDEQRVLSVGEGGVARWWGLVDDVVLAHDGPVEDIAFSPGGDHMIVGTRVGSVYRWAVGGEARPPSVLHQGAGDPARRVVYDPLGRYVAVTSWGGTVRVWQVGDHGGAVAVLRNNTVINDICFSPDGRWLACGGVGGVAIWDVRTWSLSTRLRPLDGPVERVGFHSDGSALVAASLREVRTWTMGNGGDEVEGGRFKDDVTGVAMGGRGRVVVLPSLEGWAVWRAGTTSAAAMGVYSSGRTYAAAVSPDGWSVVTAGWDAARVWSTEDLSESFALEHRGKVYTVSYSPNGRFIATGAGDRTARVWDAATGEPLTSPLRHDGRVTEVVYSPDSRWLATADGAQVSLWDLSPAEGNIEALSRSVWGLSEYQTDARDSLAEGMVP